MANDGQIAEAFYGRGCAAARFGYPKVSQEQFRSEGFDPYGYRFYVRGYDETFAAMTESERRAAALKARS